MNKTKIPWADYTWNPIVGCSPASEGCANCYAAGISKRFHLPWGKPVFKPERLDEPGQLKTPSRIFVCSMSDLFHPGVDHEWLFEVMHVIETTRWHTFILLTKRPENIPKGYRWPSNAWIGVTAENQARYNERWTELQRALASTDMTFMFASVEPMLGPVTLGERRRPDWIIAGPENGPKKRECKDEWIDELAAQSPCFFDKRDGDGLRREFPA